MAGVRHISGSIAVSLTLALLAACGVNAQDAPVPVEVRASPPPTTDQARVGDEPVTVYFVRHGRLLRSSRSAPDTSLPSALALLLAGPRGTEATMGLQTALVPQELKPDLVGDRVITIAATRDFTSISGDNQLLAAAQLVWTVTDTAPTNRVRVTDDGKAIEVPTDHGLTRQPVGRDDYRSVAPPPEPPTPRPRTPTPS